MKFSLLAAPCLIMATLVGLWGLAFAPAVQAQTQTAGGSCGGSGRYFLGIPSWDRGLERCEDIEADELLSGDSLQILINNFVAIAAHVAALVAIGFIIYGGFSFVLASGNSEQAASARRTIINAAIGAVIVIMARVATEIIYINLTG